VIGSGLLYLADHPEKLLSADPESPGWFEKVMSGDWHLAHAPLRGQGPWVILAVCLLFFPKLALGLSGFETGVAGDAADQGRPG